MLNRPKILGALLGIALLHVAISAAWMYLNGFFNPVRPPFHDCAYFRLDALDIQERMESEGAAGLIQGGLEHDRPHPPLLAMLNAVAGLSFGRIDVSTQWVVQAAYLVAFAFALYLLGREVLASKGQALAYAALALAAPVYIASVRVALPKFPMMVMVFFALHALIRTSMFAKRGWSAAFGFWSGLATMTMMLAPIYLAGSALVAGLVGLKRGPRGRVLVNAALSVAVAAAIVATWYPAHWGRVSDYAAEVTSPEGQRYYSGGVGMWEFRRWGYYPLQLLNNGLGFFLTVAIALVVVLRTVSRKSVVERTEVLPKRSGLILSAGVLVSFVVISRGQVAAESQYIMNVPALAMLWACRSAWTLRSDIARKIATVLLVVGTLISAGLCLRSVEDDRTPGYETPWVYHLEGHLLVSLCGRMDSYGGDPARMHGVRASPDAEPWPLEELLDLMEQHRTFGEIRYGQIIGSTHAYLTPANLSYVARLRGLGFRIENTPGFPPFQASDLSDFAQQAEFTIIDTTYAKEHIGVRSGVDSTLEGLSKLGATTRILFDRKITALSHLVLHQILHPSRKLEVRQDVPADAASSRAQWSSGWQLVGLTPALTGEDELSLTTYWKMREPVVPGHNLLARVEIPKTSGTGYETLQDRRLDLYFPTARKSEGPILMLHQLGLPFPKKAQLLLINQHLGPQGEYLGEAVVESSNLQPYGPKALLAVVREADGTIKVMRTE